MKNKFTFIQVEVYHPRIEKPMEHGWMLKIDSIEALIWRDVKRGDYGYHFEQGLLDLNKRFKITDAVSDCTHGTSTIGGCCAMMAELDPSRSYRDHFLKFCNDVFITQMKNIQEHGAIYINASGGYFYKTEHVNELTSEGVIESDLLIWPKIETIPRYIQWQNGTHWYVKVGSQDVVVDGWQKWDTKKEAELAFDKWKEINNLI